MKVKGRVLANILGLRTWLPGVRVYDSGSVSARLDTGHLTVVKRQDIIEFIESET